MSSQVTAPIARELIGFEGAVDCQGSAGPVSLRLRGNARDGARAAAPGGAAEVLFSGAGAAHPASAPLPAVLHQVRVLELGPAAFCIESREGSYQLRDCNAQLHWDPAAAFFALLPPSPVSRSTRLGWWLVLSLLRVPGAARLLAKLRG